MAERAAHLVEGIPNGMAVHRFAPGRAADLPPVLLLHGFASSAELNWVSSGWVRALAAAGRTVLAPDLPGHGSSPSPAERDAYAPSRVRADLLQLLEDEGVRPTDPGDPGSGVDVVGYSLGSRLAWEFAATQPQLVRRLVLAGAAAHDPLAGFDLAAAQGHLAGGPPPSDPPTAELLAMARRSPGVDLFALLTMVEAVKAEPYTPASAVPRVPVLLASGELDGIAATLPELERLLREHGGSPEMLTVPGRDHVNAVTARTLRDAAVGFLGG